MRFAGLVAAVHTPFAASGELNLDVVERQAEFLAASGVAAVFVGGTTGESSSLTVDERLALAARWGEVVKGSSLRLVVHVGSNCLSDARAMAAHAESVCGAAAIAAVAPCYFKPRTLDDLIACCSHIAAAAPRTPFYYYDIPSMTGISHSVPAFLAAAPARVPTLAGVKFTNPDLGAYRMCVQAEGGRFDVPWGLDEHLLGALATGATGAVGSSYNVAAPNSRRLIDAFARGDVAAARLEQDRSIRVIDALKATPPGYLPATKAVMGFLGVDVGQARLPLERLSEEDARMLRRRLDEQRFFDAVATTNT